MESGYLSTCVSTPSAYFLYECVCVCLYDVCIPVSDRQHVCVCRWHFWTQELYPPPRSPFNARHHAHTNTHHTYYCWHVHVTTATRYSQRHATDREAETTSCWDRLLKRNENFLTIFLNSNASNKSSQLGILALIQETEPLISYTACLVLTYAKQVRSISEAFHTCGSHCGFDLVQSAQYWNCHLQSGARQISCDARAHLQDNADSPLIWLSRKTKRESNIYVSLYGNWNEFHAPLLVNLLSTNKKSSST